MHPTISPWRSALFAALLAALTNAALARQSTEPPPTDAAQTPAASAAEPPRGILPLPDYSGDLGARSYLLGDLGGARSRLAEAGLTVAIDWTQVVQSVVDGGETNATEYGGSLDYLVNLDLDRMGAIPGGLLTFRGESRYGLSVNGDAGPIAPVNFDAMVPLTGAPDEGIPIAVTSLNYTQFFSPHLAIMVGKFDTADGDANEFASGRGVSQFMNSSFVANGVFAVGLPYSTLGTALVWMPSPKLKITAIFANSADSSTTTGFDAIGDGWLGSAEANLQYRLGELPGGITAGGFYVGNSSFAKFGSRLAFERGEGLNIPTDDSVWCLYANTWQYLYVKDKEDAPIKLADGRPDRRGIGIFARAGLSDQETDPIGWSLSGGLGGRGMLPQRDNDTFGIGYFYNNVVSGRIFAIAGYDDHLEGVELFYNIAITPAASLTLDFQYIDAAASRVDPSTVLAARFSVRF